MLVLLPSSDGNEALFPLIGLVKADLPIERRECGHELGWRLSPCGEGGERRLASSEARIEQREAAQAESVAVARSLFQPDERLGRPLDLCSIVGTFTAWLRAFYLCGSVQPSA